MKYIIIVLLIVLVIGCNSVVGPEWIVPDIPSINYPKNGIYITGNDGDTIFANWEIIDGYTRRYYSIVYPDSIEVAKDDSISIFKNDFYTAPKHGVRGPNQGVHLNGSMILLIIKDFDFRDFDDTIKVFWKIKAESDSIEGLFSGWSDIESFYIVKK